MKNQYPLKLPETEQAIRESWVVSGRSFGSHSTSREELSRTGQQITEIPYDDRKHHHLRPNPLSIREAYTGERHIPVRRPRKPMDIDFVIHVDSKDSRGAEWITRAKDSTAKTIAQSFMDMSTGFGDRLFTHLVGDVGRFDSSIFDPSLHESFETSDNIEATKAIAEISNDGSGLTYVMSSFSGLSLDQLDSYGKTSLRDTVGIKINHLYELELQPDGAIWATGESSNPYIYTKDLQQLAGWNEIKADRQKHLFSRLGNLGMSVAQVVFEGRRIDPNFGFNTTEADIAIAEATKKVASSF